jgi:AcrR family transcriptional regulator
MSGHQHRVRTPVGELLEAPLGLRERKKLRTRRAIRHEAFRLFAEQGYENTTVDQIAAAAEVSPSTFFRYFPTKEDLVVTDDYDPFLESALRARPAEEPPLAILKFAMTEGLRLILDEDREEILARMLISRQIPALRARAMAEAENSRGVLLRVLSERTGRAVDDYDLRVVVAAALGAATTAMDAWTESGGRADIVRLMDRAMDLLTSGLPLAAKRRD